MKKCPACDKEFPDSMRFCQTDGTLLVEKQDDAPVDPYKTVVGNQSEIAAAIPPADPFKTMVASPPPKKTDDDILQLPEEPDSMKTLIVSPDELKAGMKSNDIEGSSPLDLPPPPSYAPSAPLIEPKPIAGSGAMPPKASEPFSAPPNFGDVSASKPEGDPSSAATAVIDKNDVPPNPPSPFDSKPFENDFSGNSPYGNQENKPIPSPFDLSMPPGYLPPSMNPFNESKSPASNFDEPKLQNPFDAPSTPFGSNEPFNQPLQPTEWTPPPAPDASWQNQEIGANTPFQPPAAAQGLNQTLPIVSLVLGIISLCCYTGWLTGPAALITGYLGLKNIKSNPNQYGGKGLATAGMIIGGIFTLLWVIYWIFIIIVYAGLFAGGAFSR